MLEFTAIAKMVNPVTEKDFPSPNMGYKIGRLPRFIHHVKVRNRLLNHHERYIPIGFKDHSGRCFFKDLKSFPSSPWLRFKKSQLLE